MSLEFSTVALNDIVSLVIDYRGKTPKKLGADWSESGIRALSAKNIKTGQIIREDAIRYVDIELYNKWMKDEIKRNDILITSEAPFGEVFFWDSDEKIVLSQRLFGVRCDENKVDPKFIYFYMTSEMFQWELQSRATGTTVKGLRQPELLKCQIQLPNIDNQRRISYILSNIESKINVLKELNKNLTEISTRQFSHLINNNIEEYLELKYICKFIKGRKPKEISEQYKSNFSNYLTIEVLSNQNHTYAYDEKGIIANEYDILMVMDGASSGKLFYGKQGLVGSTLAKIDVDKEYLEIIYQFLKFNEKYISDNTTGSAIPHTDKGLVLNLKCPISKKLLDYSEFFKTIRSNIILNNNEIIKLQKLRDALIPKLMSGEIDVTKINCDLKIIIIKFIFNPLKYLWRYLNENKDYIKNTKSNETLFESRTIYKIDKFFIKFTSRYRDYR